MEALVSEILENILGLMALEGSFEVVEGPEETNVSIETTDPGRLIGFRGETLDSLQLIVNLILSHRLSQTEEEKETAEKKESKPAFKRVIIDVGGWRKNKEGDLERRARAWAEEVLEKKQPVELDPMPSWQRRIVHMVISEIPGVESESLGEGSERHLVIKPASGKAAERKETDQESSEQTS